MIDCVFENGRKANLRHVTVDGLVIKNGKILLVKRADNVTSNPSKFAFPGGFVNRDELLRESAVREVEEETGIKCKIISLFKITDKPDRRGEDRQNINFTFLMQAQEKTGNPDEEISKTKWFELENLPQEDEFGFDHFEILNLYLKHLKLPFKLPIVGDTL